MSANSVSALAYRAREGLRQAFLSAHLAETERDRLPVGRRAPRRLRPQGLASATGQGRDPPDGCRTCTAMYLELTEVNSNLAGIIAPLLLGALAAGYLATAGRRRRHRGGSPSWTGPRTSCSRNVVPVAAGTTAAAGAAATAVATALTGGGQRPVAGRRRQPPSETARPPRPADPAPPPTPRPRRTSAPTARGSATGLSPPPLSRRRGRPCSPPTSDVPTESSPSTTDHRPHDRPRRTRPRTRPGPDRGAHRRAHRPSGRSEDQHLESLRPASPTTRSSRCLRPA